MRGRRRAAGGARSREAPREVLPRRAAPRRGQSRRASARWWESGTRHLPGPASSREGRHGWGHGVPSVNFSGHDLCHHVSPQLGTTACRGPRGAACASLRASAERPLKRAPAFLEAGAELGLSGGCRLVSPSLGLGVCPKHVITSRKWAITSMS